MSISNKNFIFLKLISIILVTIILFVSFYFLIFKPQKNDYISLKKLFLFKQKILTDSEIKISQKEILEKKLNDSKNNLSFAEEKKLISEKDVPGLMEKISELAKREGIDIVSTLGSKKEEKNYLVIPLEIDIRSNYHSIGKFLLSLNNISDNIDIESLNVSPINEKNNSSNTVMAKLSYVIFIR